MEKGRKEAYPECLTHDKRRSLGDIWKERDLFFNRNFLPFLQEYQMFASINKAVGIVF